MPVVNQVLNTLPAPLVRAAIHRFWRWQEPELRRIDDYLPNDRTALDVGAWWGPWTSALAKRCPAVHCFEPQPHLVTQLGIWVPRHVTVHQAGVGSAQGTATLRRPNALPGTDGLATLRPAGEPGDDETLTVDVVAIDDLAIDDVGFIKIDVEGLELAALKGAEQTIARHRPRLMIEIEQRHLDHPIDVVFDWLADRSYDGWFLRPTSSGRSIPGRIATTWRPQREFNIEADQTAQIERPKGAHYINAFLFTPREQPWQAPNAR